GELIFSGEYTGVSGKYSSTAARTGGIPALLPERFVLNGITIAATTSCRESFNAHKVGIAKPPLAIATILISLLFVENRLLKSLPYRKL
ncbi:MAG: hypothetical protein ACI4QC_00660, partial [Thermoguttaceae bacterium]